MITQSWRGWKRLAIIWLIFISILFFLPGSALPKEDWLDKIYFDKWVHFILFTVLLFLWRFYFPVAIKYSALLIVAAILYGLGVEVIQEHYIPNRSFDLGDVAADTTGAFAGLLYWTGRYIKK